MCILLLPLSLKAQKEGEQVVTSPKIDSLLTRLSTAKNDTNKVNILNTISLIYKDITPDKGISYCQQALNLSQTLSWKKGIIEAYTNLAKNFYSKSDFKAALAYFEKSLLLNKEQGDNTAIIKNLIDIGDIYAQLGIYAKALEYNFNALKIAEGEKKQDNIADCFRNIGFIYFSEGNYSISLENYFKGLKLFRLIKDNSKITFTLKSIGNVYYVQNKYNEALLNYREALQISEKSGNKMNSADNLMSLGNVFSDENDNVKALDYQFKALKLFEELDNKGGLANILGNIGITYFNIASDSIGPIPVYNKIPKSKPANIKLAIDYLSRAINIEKVTGQLNILLQCYDALSQAYELSGNYKDALKNHQLYVAVKDSVFSVQKITSLAKVETERDMEEQKEIAKVKELQNKREKIFYSFGIGLLLLIVVVIGLGYRTQRKLNQKITQLVNEQEHTIKERTKDLAESNEKLAESNEKLAVSNEKLVHNNKELIALIQFNAHNVREPLTRIMGAMSIQEYMTTEEFNEEIWPAMQIAVNDLDRTIKEVIKRGDDAVDSHS